MDGSGRKLETLVGGGAFFECPRWHDGRLWVSDYWRHQVVAISPEGTTETVVEVPGSPSGLGWLPDGTLLVVSMQDTKLLRVENGSTVVHADLSAHSGPQSNDMVVDAAGRACVSTIDFAAFADMPVTNLVRVDPDGSVSVADSLLFPNGSVITPDGSTLIVADSWGQRLTAFDPEPDGSLVNRRDWARFAPPQATGTPGQPAEWSCAPDGITLDAEGAVWVAWSAPDALRAAAGRPRPAGSPPRCGPPPAGRPSSTQGTPMGSVSWRKRGHRYLVSWRLDDRSQGGKTVDTPDEARDLAAQKRLEMRRGTWRGRQRGRLSFNAWATEWWDTWAADEPSPTSLASAESRLRLHVRPWFADRPIDKITPADVRRWQAHLDHNVGPATLAQCRSLALRIFQFATDEGAIDANPVHKVPPAKRRVDPDEVFGEVKRRALTPEEAGRLLACFPLFWWDHLSTLLGTGLRFGELAGLRRRRVHLGRAMPVVEVGPTRYEAGRFGSGFKPRPKSDAGIRQVPLAPLVVEAIRRQLPPGSDPDDLVFTGPGGGGPGVPRGTRTVLSRHNLHRTYQGALTKLADPAAPLRPTARRTLLILRDGGPQRVGQLAARLTAAGRRPIRPATVAVALGELHAAGLAAVDDHDQDELTGRWVALPVARDPLLDAVDLHGAHDFRHTFATWLEDAGIPARVIDELMGHQASSRSGLRGDAIGAYYRHTTPRWPPGSLPPCSTGSRSCSESRS